ncbi:MAG: EscU/YscU/HrcU family type III secretion system export apparatus switch protein [Alkalispirochaetaceae bacterium]
MREKVGRSVALRYDKTLPAPFVVARGRGRLAEELNRLAREHGVPIVEDEELSGLLYEVEVGESIPIETFEAVARVLAFVYSVSSQKGLN